MFPLDSFARVVRDDYKDNYDWLNGSASCTVFTNGMLYFFDKSTLGSVVMNQPSSVVTVAYVLVVSGTVGDLLKLIGVRRVFPVTYQSVITGRQCGVFSESLMVVPPRVVEWPGAGDREGILCELHTLLYALDAINVHIEELRTKQHRTCPIFDDVESNL